LQGLHKSAIDLISILVSSNPNTSLFLDDMGSECHQTEAFNSLSVDPMQLVDQLERQGRFGSTLNTGLSSDDIHKFQQSNALFFNRLTFNEEYCINSMAYTSNSQQNFPNNSGSPYSDESGSCQKQSISAMSLSWHIPLDLNIFIMAIWKYWNSYNLLKTIKF
jgi:hypothetical protein